MDRFLTKVEIDQRVGEDTARKLTDRGIPANDFVWLLKVREVVFRDGEKANNVWCGLAGGRLHFFPLGNIFKRLGWVDWEVASVATDGVVFSVGKVGAHTKLGIQSPTSSRIAQAEIILDEPTLSSAIGAWLDTWRAAIGSQMGFGAAPFALGLIERREWRLKEEDFGLTTGPAESAVFCGVEGQQVKFFPATHVPSLRCRSWIFVGDATKSVLTLLIEENKFPVVVEMTERIAGHQPRANESLCALLGRAPRAKGRADWKLENSGIFTIQSGEGKTVRKMLRLENGFAAVKEFTEESEERMDQVWILDSRNAILANYEGGCLRVSFAEGGAPKLAAKLPAHHQLLPGPECSKWAAGVVKEQAQNVSIFDHETRIGSERLGFAETESVKAERQPDGRASVSAKVRTSSGATVDWKILLPEKLGFSLCEEWEIRRTRFQHATAGIPALYAEFNNAKKYNLLTALFSDVVTLNRRLEEGIPMSQLVATLQQKDAGAFFQDEKLKEATVEKIQMLAAVIPQIKRNFEEWVALYPYFWANQDAEWIAKIFGADTANQLAPMQRRRKVPLVRQAVRNAQAGMQRALGEIEAAIRELDRSLARNDVQKQGSYTLWQSLPLASRAAGTMASAAGAMAMGLAAAPTLIGGGVLMLSMAASKFASDKIKGLEEAALFQRTASNAFPWWQVFMRTLGVSLYETAQLIDEENVRGMKLDRQLFDKLSPAAQAEVQKRLASELRERILAEKRNGFAELLEGSGYRVSQVVEAIQGSLLRDVAQFEAQFSIESGHQTPTNP